MADSRPSSWNQFIGNMDHQVRTIDDAGTFHGMGIQNTGWGWNINNNNNNSYIALYPVKIYKLAALTSKSARQSKRYKYYKYIHQYQNDKKARMRKKTMMLSVRTKVSMRAQQTVLALTYSTLLPEEAVYD